MILLFAMNLIPEIGILNIYTFFFLYVLFGTDFPKKKYIEGKRGMYVHEIESQNSNSRYQTDGEIGANFLTV